MVEDKCAGGKEVKGGIVHVDTEITKISDKSNVGESGSEPRAKTVLVTNKEGFFNSLRVTRNIYLTITITIVKRALAVLRSSLFLIFF